jgi:Ca2+-binding EF-hand superfamily protein
VQRGLSGNLLNAVSGWIENASPDKGYERVTELFIENQQAFGRTIEELLKSSEFQTRLLFLVKKEQEELEKFMKDNRIKFNPEDKLDLRSLGSIGTMDSFDAYHSADAAKGAKSVINKYSAKAPEDRATVEYDAKYKALQDYLKAFFSSYDKKNTGFFTETEFWELMKKLPLPMLGLTEAEVDAMMQWSEWVSDEKVVYHEAIFELADSILTAIEGKSDGETDVLAVVAELNNQHKLGRGHSEAKVARHDSVEDISEVPDYFLQYIYDTFYAYDFDNNGFLCKTELDSVLPVLNISMTYKDFLKEEVILSLQCKRVIYRSCKLCSLLTCADFRFTLQHDRIIHKDAVQIIARKIRMWFLDSENDNYVSLCIGSFLPFLWNTRRRGPVGLL